MVPRQILDTFRPVEPRLTYSIEVFSRLTRPDESRDASLVTSLRYAQVVNGAPLQRSLAPVLCSTRKTLRSSPSVWRFTSTPALLPVPVQSFCPNMLGLTGGNRSVFSLFAMSGQVGEWLKPADCKSARPCGVRRFESFPVHQF